MDISVRTIVENKDKENVINISYILHFFKQNYFVELIRVFFTLQSSDEEH